MDVEGALKTRNRFIFQQPYEIRQSSSLASITEQSWRMYTARPTQADRTARSEPVGGDIVRCEVGNGER